MMVLHRADGRIKHKYFYELGSYLKAGDCLVFNDTKVIPARLLGQKADTGAAVEILLLKRHAEDVWECLAKSGKKLRSGAEVLFGAAEGRPEAAPLRARIESVCEDGNRMVRFFYQGIRSAYVKLHVGLGTFRPVKEENILDHHMHTENCRIDAKAAETINRTRAEGGRIICVGTTSVRTLESFAAEGGRIAPGEKETDLFAPELAHCLHLLCYHTIDNPIGK